MYKNTENEKVISILYLEFYYSNFILLIFSICSFPLTHEPTTIFRKKNKFFSNNLNFIIKLFCL